MALSPAIQETDLGNGVCISAPAAGPYQEAAGQSEVGRWRTRFRPASTCCRTGSWMRAAAT